MDQRLDVLEFNKTAEALIFGKPSMKPMNLARSIFSAPGSRNRYVDWRDKAEDVAAILRFARAKFPHDAAIPELIDELKYSGAAFRHICAKHGVLEKKNGRRRLYDSKGRIVDTYYETLTFPADPHLTLVIYLPKTDTPCSTISDNQRPTEVCFYAIEGAGDLPAQNSFREARLPPLQGLAHAHNWGQAVLQSRLELQIDHVVGLVGIHSALRMA